MTSKKSKPSGILTSKTTGVSIAALIVVALAGAASAQSGSVDVGVDIGVGVSTSGDESGDLNTDTSDATSATANASCDQPTADHIWAEIEEVQVAQKANIVIAEDCLADELWINTDIKTAAMSNGLVANMLHDRGYEQSDILGVELVSPGHISIFVENEM